MNGFIQVNFSRFVLEFLGILRYSISVILYTYTGSVVEIKKSQMSKKEELICE